MASGNPLPIRLYAGMGDSDPVDSVWWIAALSLTKYVLTEHC